MSSAELSWGRLYYEDAGSGMPLLLISGLNGLARPWTGIVPALAAQFRVITHDHRGLGASDGWDGPYSVEQMVGDVLALMDHLHISRAHIVGHSLGGAVAQALAVEHPERVAGLVIYASWCGPEPYFCRVMNMRREMLTGLGVEAFVRSGPIGIYPPDWIARNDAVLSAGFNASCAAFPGTDVMLRRIDACLAHDRRASIGQIAAPTLVLGLQDDMSTPSHCSEEIAALIGHSQLKLLPYGGHNAHLVVPRLIQQSISEFLLGSSAKC
ncbi:MAG TPA: alpha/beta fold hydrolase [Pseudomonas sp.]|jgi:aminoacrylate hydrolase|uniref:alpha/beta fold hydrolase n=1 Tax=Pseudomonas sp. TaxID=306 RepID=UPI002ED7E31C